MRTRILLITISVCAFIFLAWKIKDGWKAEKHKGYLLYSTDHEVRKEYNDLVETGIVSVQKFFGGNYKNEFNIFFHPDRHSLDSTWQKDWKMPEFKSECWMVASGIANRLDVIAPINWEKEACEHKYSDHKKTQDVFTHELVHVYHGQLNVSPDFSNVEGLDWFVEGLATYASGQCDEERLKEVKKMITEGNAPNSLDDLWKGKAKYGLSGSMVMYMDKTFGREKLKGLLSLNKKTELLKEINTSEEQLLKDWKIFLTKK